jgi:hypothetical protein
MPVFLKVAGRGSLAMVERYLYGTSVVIAGEEVAESGTVWALVRLEGVNPQVQIDRYASGLFGAKVVDLSAL